MKINITSLNDFETNELKEFLTTITILNTSLDYELNILDETMKEQIHKKYLKSKWVDKYSYRAFTLPMEKVIYVFFNEGETIESLKWVIAHELTHANLRTSNYLKVILNHNRQLVMSQYNITCQKEYEKKLKDDSFHEDMLEEKICNKFATDLIGKNYDRNWWRNKIKENLKKTS